MKKFYLLLIVFALLVSCNKDTLFNSKFLTSDNLLTADKSSNGDIWIGTSDAGAMLYNGHSFKTFDKLDSEIPCYFC